MILRGHPVDHTVPHTPTLHLDGYENATDRYSKPRELVNESVHLGCKSRRWAGSTTVRIGLAKHVPDVIRGTDAGPTRSSPRSIIVQARKGAQVRIDAR
jgi:hypothetical protein